MTKRVINGLEWARAAERPVWAGTDHPRGVKAQGLRYENALARALPKAKSSQWWEFFDQNGYGICQTDLVWHFPDHLVCFEAKLSDNAEARVELMGLYLPILRMVYKKPVRGIVVAKHLSKESPSQTTDQLYVACALAAHSIPTLHWLGLTTLDPHSAPFRRRKQSPLAQLRSIA